MNWLRSPRAAIDVGLIQGIGSAYVKHVVTSAICRLLAVRRNFREQLRTDPGFGSVRCFSPFLHHYYDSQIFRG